MTSHELQLLQRGERRWLRRGTVRNEEEVAGGVSPRSRAERAARCGGSVRSRGAPRAEQTQACVEREAAARQSICPQAASFPLELKIFPLAASEEATRRWEAEPQARN
ncbi:hypothetical protein KIL84_017213 [Mauremys mutica]|uniref:Uncharacterized protein n=1 Tax=Mauremys mutica TaxID=74926 RepID=A0A9D3X3X2_9SAUR|nr:hypothetical protein KIL84_017213 [Mauremys mutica]